MGDNRYFPERPAPSRRAEPPVRGDWAGGHTPRTWPEADAYGAPYPDPVQPAHDPYHPAAPAPGQGGAFRSVRHGQPAWHGHDEPQVSYPPDPYGAHSDHAAPHDPYPGYDVGAYQDPDDYPAYDPEPRRARPHPGLAARPAHAGQAPYADAPPYAAAAPAWLDPRRASATAAPAPAPARAPLRPAALAHGLGAVLSLGLVVVAGAWTWNMMQRDVSGVPVVRALEGPMRISPEQPGGRQAEFQGLAINELAGSGTVAEAESIVLAPPPIGLQDVLAPAGQVMSATDLSQAAPAQPVAPVLGFVNPNRLAVTSSPRPRGRDSAQTVLVAQPASPTIAAPALSTSNDPQSADALAASIAQSVAVGLAGPRGIDVDPASIGPGTRLVQLGAYDTADEARAAWDALARRFSPLLTDRGRVIEAAHSGGSVFYRLRAHGFSDERDARRFCSALVAEQVDCIPVLVR